MPSLPPSMSLDRLPGIGQPQERTGIFMCRMLPHRPMVLHMRYELSYACIGSLGHRYRLCSTGA
jgi:hypothetical protein